MTKDQADKLLLKAFMEARRMQYIAYPKNKSQIEAQFDLELADYQKNYYWSK